MPSVPPTPAATVVILRDDPSGRLQTLLLKRNTKGAFAGMWVFPGGQVEDGDGPVSATEADAETAEERVARYAAVREAEEEAGIRLDPDSLVRHSWWLPPSEAPRRFSTWFFLAPLPAQSAVAIDGGEILASQWYGPADALAARDRGEIGLAPPTWMTLWWLSSHPDTRSALRAAAQQDAGRFVTRIVSTDDGRLAIWDGDAAYKSGDISAEGPRRRLVMGPGPWYAEVKE